MAKNNNTLQVTQVNPVINNNMLSEVTSKAIQAEQTRLINNLSKNGVSGYTELQNGFKAVADTYQIGIAKISENLVKLNSALAEVEAEAINTSNELQQEIQAAQKTWEKELTEMNNRKEKNLGLIHNKATAKNISQSARMSGQLQVINDKQKQLQAASNKRDKLASEFISGKRTYSPMTSEDNAKLSSLRKMNSRSDKEEADFQKLLNKRNSNRELDKLIKEAYGTQSSSFKRQLRELTKIKDAKEKQEAEILQQYSTILASTSSKNIKPVVASVKTNSSSYIRNKAIKDAERDIATINDKRKNNIHIDADFRRIKVSKPELSNDEKEKIIADRIRYNEEMKSMLTENIMNKGKPMTVKGLIKGRAKDREKAILTSYDLRPFVDNDGNYVSPYNNNGEARKVLGIRSSNKALNFGSFGDLGDLREASITQLFKAFDKLEGITITGSKVDKEKAEQGIEAIINTIEEAYHNTESVNNVSLSEKLLKRLEGTDFIDTEERASLKVADMLGEKTYQQKVFRDKSGAASLLRQRLNVDTQEHVWVREDDAEDITKNRDRQADHDTQRIQSMLSKLTAIAKENKDYADTIGAVVELLNSLKGVENGKVREYSPDEALKIAEDVFASLAEMQGVNYKGSSKNIEASLSIDEDRVKNAFKAEIAEQDTKELSDSPIINDLIARLKLVLNANYSDSEDEITDYVLQLVSHATEQGAERILRVLDGDEDTKEYKSILHNFEKFYADSKHLLDDEYTDNVKAKASKMGASLAETAQAVLSKTSQIIGESYAGPEDEHIDMNTFNEEGYDASIKLINAMESSLQGLAEHAHDNSRIKGEVDSVNKEIREWANQNITPEEIYNKIGNILTYSEGVRISIARYIEEVNKKAGKELLNVEDELKKWYAGASDKNQRAFDRSESVRRAYESNGLEGIFSLDDKYIKVIKSQYEKLPNHVWERSQDIKGNVKEINTSKEDFVKQGIEYRLDKTNLIESPTAFDRRGNFTGIRGETYVDSAIAREPISRALMTQLFYKGGYTGERYGGDSLIEDIERANEELSSKQAELLTAKGKQKKAIEAQIAVIKNDITVMEKASKTVKHINPDTYYAMAYSRLEGVSLPDISNETAEKLQRGIGWDTETTSANFKDKSKNKQKSSLDRLPITFAASLLKDSNIGSDMLLSYGSTDKTLKVLLEAMTVPNKNGELTKSSIELRKKFGVGSSDITDKDKDNLRVIIEEQAKNYEEVYNILSTLLEQVGEGAYFVGFNSQEYDESVVQRWLEQSGASQEWKNKFKTLLSNNSMDIMKVADEKLGLTDTSGKLSGHFTGINNLQSMRKLFMGETDENAHDAMSDVLSVGEVAGFILDGDVLQTLGQVIEEIAEAKDIARYDAQGHYTEEYKQIAKQALEAMSSRIAESKVFSINENKLSSPVNELSDTIEDVINEEKIENVALQEVDTKQHVSNMEEAIEAELNKKKAAEELTEALLKEADAFEKVNSSINGNVNLINSVNGNQISIPNPNVDISKKNALNPSFKSSDVSVRLIPVNFDSDSHTYTLSDGNKVDMTATESRDLLTRLLNVGLADSINKVEQEIINNLGQKGSVTADSLNMLESDFQKVVAIKAQGYKGDITHNAIELLASTGTNTLAEAQTIDPEAYKHFEEERAKNLAKLETLGFDDTYVDLDNSLEALLNLLNKYNISLSKFTEQAMALEFVGPDGNKITVGLKPDQYMMMNGMTMPFDTKTGSIKGTETLQLSLEGLLLKVIQGISVAEAERLGISSDMKSHIDSLNPVDSAYIHQSSNGRSQLLEYKELPLNVIYSLLQKANDIKQGNDVRLNIDELQILKNYRAGTTLEGTSQAYDNRLTSEDEERQLKLVKDLIAARKELSKINDKVSQADTREMTLPPNSQVREKEELKNRAIRREQERAQIGYQELLTNFQDEFNNSNGFSQKALDILREDNEDERISVQERKLKEQEALQIAQIVQQEQQRKQAINEQLDLARELVKTQKDLQKASEDVRKADAREFGLTGDDLEKERFKNNKYRRALTKAQYDFDKANQNWLNNTKNNPVKNDEAFNIVEKVNEDERNRIDEDTLRRKEDAEIAAINEFDNQQEQQRKQQEKENIQFQNQLNKSIKDSISLLKQWYKLDNEIYELELKLANVRDDERLSVETQIANKQLEQELVEDEYSRQISEVTHVSVTHGLTDEQNNQLNEGFQQAQEVYNLNREQAENNAALFISKQHNKNIQDYLKSYKELLKVQRDIRRVELQARNSSGNQKEDYERQLEILRQQRDNLQEETNEHDNFNSRDDNGDLIYSQEELNRLQEEQNKLDQQHQVNLQGIEAQYNRHRSVLQMLFGTFQQSITRFFDYSAVYMLINEVKKVVSDIVKYTSDLDAKMVNLQIASGESRENIKSMLVDYNQLASEIGRTTASVADAANDWLRAGYEGKEATELVRGSMYLSTLGMMDAETATSDLISVLKGWKLSTEEVIEVVDKLVKVDMNAAVNSGEIAEAMQMVNYSAQQAGLTLDTLIGILTTNKDVTQRSAQVVGNSWKTIIARIQNVKASKYEPTDLDKAAEDFHEEDWAALNDVEIVLSKLGIKLRKTANSWRDLEDVLNEVATKWDNFDDVTKSAIANAFAGTRQRENFIATIANWDKVQTYSSISENAYGTATQKMEAYTNSIDAAKNSITQAVEKWALMIDGMDVMRDFYNLIGDVVENLDILLVTLAGLIVLSNFEQVVNLVINGFGNLESRIVEFGNVLQTYSNNIAGSGQTVTQAVLTRRINNNQNNVLRLGLNEQQRTGFNAAQRSILSLSANAASQMLPSFQRMMNNFDNNVVAGTQYSITNSNQALNALKETGLNSQNLGILGNVLQGRGLEGLQENTRILSEYYNTLQRGGRLTAEEINNLNINFNSLRNGMAGLGTTAPQTRSALQELENEMRQVANSIRSAMSNLATMFTSMAGMYGYGQLGKAIGGTRGQMVGTILGPMLGVSSKSMLESGITGIMTAGRASLGANAATAGTGAIFSAGLSGVSASVIASTLLGTAGIGALIYGILKGISNEVIEKSQQMSEGIFKEAEEKLSGMQNHIVDASTLDELSYGVDSLGRNISLTDEEYQQFIDANNVLAEQFPELINYTDESGNKFISLGDEVSSYTEKVKRLIETQQELTDDALFEENIKTGFLGLGKRTSLYKQALEDVNKEIKEQNQGIEKAQNILSYINGSMEDFGDNYVWGLLENKLYQEGYNIDNLRDYAAQRITFDDKGNSSYDIKGTLLSHVFNNDEEAMKNFFSSYQVELNNIIQTSQNKIAKANRSLYDYNQSIIRDLSADNQLTSEGIGIGDILDKATSEYKLVLDKIVLAFDSANKDENEIRNEFSEIIQDLDNVFGDNNTILETGLMDADDFDTLGDHYKARFNLRQQLFDTFGNDINQWSNEQLEIAAALHFKISEEDEGAFLKDTDNKLQQLSNMAQSRGIRLDFSNINYSQIDDATRLMASGALDGLNNDAGQVIFDKMLQAEGPINKTSYGWNNYLEYLTAESQADLMDKAISNIIGDLDISKVKKLTKDQISDVGNTIEKELAGLPLNVRGSLKNIINDINSGAKDIANDADLGNILTENLYGSLGLEKIEAYKNQVSATLREAFDDFESFDLDNSGLIDSFEELKKTLDSIESSFKALRSAQEEYNATGELTLGTVLELIATDSNFIDLLDTSGEKIILKANAEEILAAAQLDATKTSMELALANEEERAATLKAEIKELEKGKAIVQVSEATNEQIEALRQSVTALDSETTSLMKNSYAAIADTEAKKGNTEVAQSALKNVTSVADIKTAFSASGAATTVTLTTFESRLAKAMKDSEELNKLYGAIEGTQWYEEYVNDKGEKQLRFVDRTSDYISHNADGTINYNGGSLGVWQQAINGLTLDMFKANKYSYDSSKSSSSSSKDPLTELDKIKSLLSSLNKEYYQMIVYGEMGLNNLKDNAEAMHNMYYESMRNVLEQAIEWSKEALGGMTVNDIYQINDKDTFNKMMGYYEDMQKYQVQLNNLDDEEVQDRIKILELQNADKKVIVEQYRTLLKTADTLEECLEYQKQLYEAMRDEVSTRLQIAEAQEKSAKDTLSMYEELSALSGQRLVSSQFAHDYVTNPDATGNAWLDRQREALHENSQEWMEIAELLKNPELSEEEKEQYKARQDLLHETNALIRESIGYDGGIDGSGYIDLTDDSQKGTEKNQLEHQQDLQKEREQNRQIIENIISKFETQNVAYELINQQLYRLLDFAQNEEQQLDILERIEENQRAQYDLIKGIKEFQTTKNDFELEYLNPYLNSERYNYLKDQNKQMYKEIQQNAKTEYARLWNKIYNDNIAAGATDEQASQAAYGNSDVQAALQDYMDAYKAYGDVVVSVIEDKLEHIQRKLDKIEKSKPQEWASIRQIEKFATNEIALYQQKLDVLWEQLKDIKDITDEQIKYMIDEYNDAFKAIHDMRIQALSDKLGYQDNILEAIRFAVDTQIKDLELQRDIIEKIYDDELEKLKDKEASYERTNKLIELQNKLLDTNKEKERVYRDGVGWVIHRISP